MVRLALQLLELHELGHVTDQDLAEIFNGVEGFRATSLTRILRGVKQDHYLLEAQDILEEFKQ